MLIAARAMQGALDILRPLLAESGAKPIGTFLMGTVKGDVHDIGKNLCNIMLEGAGFTVIDLGVNVPPEKFVEAINENEPDIVGFSAFLTTTMPMFKANINALQKAGIRDKVAVMVGGAPVTQEYADAVGADGYSADASSAVKKAKELLEQRRSGRPSVSERSSLGHGSAGAVQDRRHRPGAAVLHHRRAHQPDRAQAFAEELRGGDLRRSSSTRTAQMEAGADVLDVNAGIPLVDEAELLAKMLKLVQDTTDAPICIDSSVIEALEAGLAVYEGKPLVNSVTGEDERLEEILPLVAKHGAAVIGLANDETGIPETPQQRLEIATKIVKVAGDYGIPPEDVVIDPLAMTVGADTEAVTIDARDDPADPRATSA